MSSLRQIYYDLFSKVYDLMFFFYIRLLFLGSSDAKRFLKEGEIVLGKKFKNILGELSPTVYRN